MKVDLTDLVDNPRETMGIELKEWLDLTDNVAKAKLARHLAALCNHGVALDESLSQHRRCIGRRSEQLRCDHGFEI